MPRRTKQAMPGPPTVAGLGTHEAASKVGSSWGRRRGAVAGLCILRWPYGMLLLRANTLARGHSGVRPEVIEALLALLNHDVLPVVPSRGSVGARRHLGPAPPP